MGVDPITAGLGLAGLYMNNQANDMATTRADRAQEGQNAILQRQSDLFDRILGLVTEADRAGQFDPERRVQQFQNEMNRQGERDQRTLAGSMRVSGYRPGDTEIANRSESMRRGNAEAVARGSDAIRQGAFRDRLAAYSAVNPNSLNPALSVYGQREHDARGGVRSPGAFVASMSPYLMGQPNQGQQQGFRLVTDSPFDGGNGAGNPYWMRAYGR